MKQLITLILCMFLAVVNIAQQPACFNWGQEELAGVDIYDILQDKKGDYWFASNQGVYKFDGRKMVSVPLENPKSASVFNLVEKLTGEIYCNNFSGQIFSVNDSVCSIYYEVPDTLISPYISIYIDNDDDLLVSAKHLFKLLPNNQIEIIYRFEKTQYQNVLRRSNGELCFHPWLEEFYCVWKDGSLKKVELGTGYSREKIKMVSSFLELGDRLYCYDSSEVYLVKDKELNPTGLVKDVNELSRFDIVAEKFWLLKSTMGIRQLNVDRPEDRGEVLFESDFISTVLEDREGNYLLGTFGSGIKFIPSKPALDYEFPLNEKIQDMTIDANHTIYLGTVSGKVYSLDELGKLTLLISDLKKSVEFLDWMPYEEKLCIGELKIKIFDPKTEKVYEQGASSLKDAFVIDQHSFLVATNKGVAVINKEGYEWESSQVLHFSNGFKLDLTSFNKRTYSVIYDFRDSSIYAATNNGVNYLSINGEFSELKFKDKSISANALHYWKGKIYANMQEEGVLVIEKGVVQSVIENIGQVYQIESNSEAIVFSTDKGLVIYDTEENVIKRYGISDGLYSNKINDFIVCENEIWVAHQKGLQKLILSPYEVDKASPQVEVESIYVNGVLRDVSKNEFSPNQNRFEFILGSLSKRNKEEISYMYQLEGIDKNWQQNSYYDNVIEYKSLPSGNYVFKAKATYRGKESNLIQLPFTIAYPYYREGWFYMLLFLISTGAVVLLFRFQLNRQKKKAAQTNELNASKLTAIQSQMNPHFIFNALNSIQDLVLKGDVDNSYIYITKFANLVRRTLNYSDKDFIDFDSEIKLIELYLTLEKLRFKKEFNFKIITNGIDDILVPPMLVQPFIENALVHGLLHKEGSKEIEIEFRLETELICTITDNGIGRKKAMEIKERQRSDHESFSVNAIKKRFEILQEHFGGSLGFEYKDLDENGSASGTRVILRIPVKRVL